MSKKNRTASDVEVVRRSCQAFDACFVRQYKSNLSVRTEQKSEGGSLQLHEVGKRLWRCQSQLSRIVVEKLCLNLHSAMLL